MKDLTHKSLLVTIQISFWSGRKYDEQVSKEVENTHNASDAGRYNKLLVDSASLKALQKVANATRTFLYDQTLPWDDNGYRLLPSTNYFEFQRQYQTYEQDFEKEAREFLKKYPDLKLEAEGRLGTMYKESDYPTIADLQHKFGINISYMPMPDTEDFRLNLNKEEVAKIKSNIENEINNRVNSASKEIITRIRDAVKAMHEKLSNQDAIFRNSLVGNIYDLIDVLPRLNFTNDYNITDMINSLKKLTIEPETLRSDSAVRSNVAKEAKAILDKVNSFLG